MITDINLHFHMDGAMPVRLVEEFAKEDGLIPEGKTVEEMVRVTPDCRNLKEFLDCFYLIETTLNTPERMEKTAYELGRDLAAQGLHYAEFKFSPFYSGDGCMDPVLATEAVCRGMKRAREDFGIYIGGQMCAIVGYEDKINEETLELAAAYHKAGVVGFDIAGPEGFVPMEHYRPLFKKASALGMPFTIHAGECGDPENIRTAISFGAKRIGHGTAAIKSPEVMDLIRREGVTLENCVTSNIQTCAVASFEEYPIRRFFEAGLRVTCNTDDDTVSGINMQHEETILREKFGFTDADLKVMRQYALEASFAPEEWKQALK